MTPTVPALVPALAPVHAPVPVHAPATAAWFSPGTALLAQSSPALPGATELPHGAKPAGGGFNNTDLLIVLACALALSAVLFFWAFFIRKRPKTMRGALVVERAKRGSKDDSDGRKRKRKRRPDHPDNWGRNPTLGETGGLPPVRPAGEGDPEADDAADDSESQSPAPRPR